MSRAFPTSPTTRAACGLGFAALVLYTITCCRTVHWGDSGELIAAGVGLGIAHPPGHPLYSMIAHLFTWLPVGGLAWRVNWMSAVFGAAAVGLTVPFATETVRRLGASPAQALGCGIASAAAFAVTAGLWSGSTVAETTTLHAAFMVAMFALVWRIAWTQPAGRTLTQALGAAAALYGFSATNHVAGVFFLPAFASLLIGRCGREVLRPKNVAVMVACVLAGAMLYGYLPLRSLQEPLLDWGNPETPANFWWVVSVKEFQSTIVEPVSAAGAWAALADRGRYIVGEFTPPGSLLVVVGLFVLARRAPWFAASLLLAAAPLILLGLSAAFILAYFVPGALLLCIALGVGCHAVLEMAPRLPRMVAAAAALGMVTWSGTGHYAEAATQNDRGAELYARMLLDPLPEDAVLFATNMNMVFTTWALQATQDYRRDVAVIPWYWTAGDSPLTAELTRDYPDLTFLSMAELEPFRTRFGVRELTPDVGFAAVVESNLDRRPLFVGPPANPTRVGEHLVPRGGVFEIQRTAGAPVSEASIASVRAYWGRWMAYVDDDPHLSERPLQLALANDLNNQALWFERRGHPQVARWEYSAAVRLAPRQVAPYLNRGRLASEADNWPAALAEYRMAVNLEPRNAAALVHLGMAEDALGRPERAYEAYMEALLWAPRHARALRRAGMLMLRAGELERAESLLTRALAAAPEDGVAARGLVRVALAAGDNRGAIPALRRARQVDPDSIHLLLLTAEYAARTGQRNVAADSLAAAYQRDPQTTAGVTAAADWAHDLLPAAAAGEG